MSATRQVRSDWLVDRAREIDRALSVRLGALLPAAPERLVEAMRYAVEGGGKRLRPLLCLAFAEACGAGPDGAPRAATLDAACSLELVHAYSLMHDDLPSMDDDDLRRGRPSCHRAYGEALAILAGDALQAEAFALLSRIRLPAEGTGPRAGPGDLEQTGGTGHAGSAELAARLCCELAQGIGASGMVGGQVLDVADDRLAELGYLKTLHAMKTGALIVAACRMGALVGGADLERLEAAGNYGAHLGLAFQIADDVLDVTATSSAMGKPTGADARAARATYPALLGLEGAREAALAERDAALAVLRPFAPNAAPLEAMARYAVERDH